jgi:hypothetical protein
VYTDRLVSLGTAREGEEGKGKRKDYIFCSLFFFLFSCLILVQFYLPFSSGADTGMAATQGTVV